MNRKFIPFRILGAVEDTVLYLSPVCARLTNRDKFKSLFTVHTVLYSD